MGCREYAAATTELQKVDLSGLGESQRKALFINLYNSIIIHGLTEFGPASNIVTRSVCQLSWSRVRAAQLLMQLVHVTTNLT